jgi:cytochrome c553
MKSTSRLLGLAVALSIAGAAGAADQKRVEELVNGKCGLCHGVQGESANRNFPRLAGQHPEYMAKQLADFKSGKRTGTAMNDMVADLGPEDMKALAAYFSAKKVGPQKVDDADLAAVGRYLYQKGNEYAQVPACASCHGPQGLGSPQLPRLAGQQSNYTVTQLKQFGKRERTNDNAIMHSIAAKLTELEMRALAEYISGLDG